VRKATLVDALKQFPQPIDFFQGRCPTFRDSEKNALDRVGGHDAAGVRIFVQPNFLHFCDIS